MTRQDKDSNRNVTGAVPGKPSMSIKVVAGGAMNKKKLHAESVHVKLRSLTLTIRAKIMLTLLIAVIFMGGVSFYPLLTFRGTLSDYDSILDNVSSINRIVVLSQELKGVAVKLITNLEAKELRKEFAEQAALLGMEVTALKGNLRSEDTAASYFKYENIVSNFVSAMTTATKLDSALSFADRNEAYEHGVRVNEFLEDQFEIMVLKEIDASKAIREELQQESRRTITATLVILLVVFVVCGSLVRFIAKHISVPIHRIATASDQVASGDLTVERVEIASRDELNGLGSSFNQMVASLKDMIAKVNDTSDVVKRISEHLQEGAAQSAAASEMIAASIQEVADGANHQAALSEEAAESIQGMYGALHSISEKSTCAKQSSDTANAVAAAGSEAIELVKERIDGIERSIVEAVSIANELLEKSKEIGTISDVISSISQSTHLLALNAAIEAARAGEAGKGFSVVANEVRSLSDQSNRAARQIGAIIDDIQTVTRRMALSMDNSK
jgi:methyl-accepting chemotaxis protein